MPKPITLTNGREWPSQTAALQHFKDMLARYADDDIVENGDDHDDLVALLERYDSAIAELPTKTGVGIDLFVRRRNDGDTFSTSGFWVRRTDGTETDFSYISAVKGQPKAPSQGFCDACRNAIAADTLAAKQRYFDEHGNEEGLAPSDISGEMIPFDQAHVDHASPTFNQIVLTFRAERGWTKEIPEDVLTPSSDAQTTTTFSEAAAAEAFREFHNGVAELRVISKRENLARSARERRLKVQRPVRLG